MNTKFILGFLAILFIVLALIVVWNESRFICGTITVKCLITLLLGCSWIYTKEYYQYDDNQ